MREYSINEKIYNVEKNREKTRFYCGLPLPTIDRKDPKIVYKIMENFYFNRSSQGDFIRGDRLPG